MNEICRIKNIDIDKIYLLFCSNCKNLISIENSKKCDYKECSRIFCEKCLNNSNSVNCLFCKKGELKNFSPELINNLDNILFVCNKSIKCNQMYSFEEKIKNHSHKNDEIIKCNKCNENIIQTANYLQCVKCNAFFCYKRLKYNPFLQSFPNKNQKSNSYCGYKCYKCNLPFCSLCNKNKYKYIICSKCSYKCELCNKNKSETICEVCNKMICAFCAQICKKCCITLCGNENKDNCLKHKAKNNSLINSNKICSLCNIKIDFSCINICENNLCKNLICINCSLFCNICKKLICKKCSIKCSSCPEDISLVSCIRCDSDAIIKCAFINCTNKVCLNCLKYCNFCKEVNCPLHSLSCPNCSETICPFHWNICKKCCPNKEDYSKNKLCLKNCTKKCYFCKNEINLFCKEENHPENFIKKYDCGHYICNNCIKKCDICKEPIKVCIECEKKENYVHCDICDKNLCYYCSKICKKCKKHYCDEMHKCHFCSIVINNEVCPYCDLNQRSKCSYCKKKLNQCNNCTKIMICSYKCFSDNIRIKIKKIKTYNHSRTIQNIKSSTNVRNNMINNVFSLFQNNDKNESISINEMNISRLNNNSIELETTKGEHLCLMYKCEEHLGCYRDTNDLIKSKSLSELISGEDDDNNNNIAKYKRITDKESTKCSACVIF